MFRQEARPKGEAAVPEPAEVRRQPPPVETRLGKREDLGNPRHPTGEFRASQAVQNRPFGVAYHERFAPPSHGLSPEEERWLRSDDTELRSGVTPGAVPFGRDDVVNSARLGEEPVKFCRGGVPEVVWSDKAAPDAQWVRVGQCLGAMTARIKQVRSPSHPLQPAPPDEVMRQLPSENGGDACSFLNPGECDEVFPLGL